MGAQGMQELLLSKMGVKTSAEEPTFRAALEGGQTGLCIREITSCFLVRETEQRERKGKVRSCSDEPASICWGRGEEQRE
uniref:Uncharacterized protein n=1 Tax=Thermogemmatispora argillosa TaxID=2045280 RepID=A0A455SYB5_9CHLR|nr:hypothetical protein KTA_15460 [Thermogemmatispora argillosa]